MEARDFFAGLIFVSQMDKLRFTDAGLIELDSMGDIPENCYAVADKILESQNVEK
ncbi:MAG: hypothetical protein PWP73_1045 [Methanococcus sp.]|jgi:hypothetical protein|uniref:Uncharacterized protein n=1 Tax=Methanococcus maripaludis KA1 TaxID=637914 RepID=A0A2Z5PJ39_METMI|nr:hypothetical protein [Methanococcus maripaludis]MDK2929447.1 hypothetical protein [Methanococcus sp.]BAP60606.1 hypothetical protein MMKA1_04890 [Methanococcus maripaludis KA1]